MCRRSSPAQEQLCPVATSLKSGESGHSERWTKILGCDLTAERRELDQLFLTLFVAQIPALARLCHRNGSLSKGLSSALRIQYRKAKFCIFLCSVKLPQNETSKFRTGRRNSNWRWPEGVVGRKQEKIGEGRENQSSGLGDEPGDNCFAAKFLL